MKKLKTLCVAIWLMTGSIPGLAHDHTDHTAHMSMSEPQSGSIYNLKDTWTTSDGKSLQLMELAGRPVLMTMIYTSCKEVCPRIVEDMKRIQRALPPDVAEKVQFVVISFDTARDTREKLNAYAKAHQIDIPAWLLARGDAGAVRRLSIALGMKYKKLSDGDFEHDMLITLLDQTGTVAYRRNNLDNNMDETIAAIKKMVEH